MTGCKPIPGSSLTLGRAGRYKKWGSGALEQSGTVSVYVKSKDEVYLYTFNLKIFIKRPKINLIVYDVARLYSQSPGSIYTLRLISWLGVCAEPQKPARQLAVD